MGDALLRDMRKLRTIPHRPRVLTLVGKGHNGGDALIATKRYLRTIPTARAVILPPFRLGRLSSFNSAGMGRTEKIGREENRSNRSEFQFHRTIAKSYGKG